MKNKNKNKKEQILDGLTPDQLQLLMNLLMRDGHITEAQLDTNNLMSRGIGVKVLYKSK